MAVTYKLVKVENKEEVEGLGAWGFAERPHKGDSVELLHGGRRDVNKEIGYRHRGIDPESIEKMPRSLNPDTRPPAMLVRYKTSSYDP